MNCTFTPQAGRLAGLLILRALLLGAPLFSQTLVLGEASPASILAGSFWTVNLLVDHPAPQEVEVRLPPLPRGLSLDRVRVEPRLVQPPSGAPNQEAGRRWTSLQYRFLAGNPGRIELGPFEVLVRGVSALSPSFSVTVRNPSAQPPRVFWRDLPRTLTVGEEAALVLCVEGWNRPDLPEGLSLPPVPPMAILEVLAPEGEGELLVLRVIPLEGPRFTFPAFSFPLGTQSLRAPSLSIPVNPAPAEPSPKSLATESPTPENPLPGDPSPDLPARAPYPPFPDSAPPAGILAGLGREIRERSRALWEEGQVVEALAELRRNERDHPAGLSLRRLRRDLERSLGLEAEPDERYSPRPLLIPGLVLSLLLAALCLTLPPGLLRPRISQESPPKRRSGALLRALSLFFSVAALFCLFRLIFDRRPSLNYRGGNPPRQALAREAPVHRVPDDRGTEIARFSEGQGLLVYEIREGWAYAESPVNGRAGWIRTGTYLIY
jgi:hypothetical protein